LNSWRAGSIAIPMLWYTRAGSASGVSRVFEDSTRVKSVSASTVHGPGLRKRSRGTAASAATTAADRSFATASISSASNRRRSVRSIVFSRGVASRSPACLAAKELRDFRSERDHFRRLRPQVLGLAARLRDDADLAGFVQPLEDGVDDRQLVR